VDKALTEVRAVYHDVAGRPMDRDCRFRAGCCHFRQTGKTPHLTRGEALVLARGLRASGRTRAAERAARIAWERGLNEARWAADPPPF